MNQEITLDRVPFRKLSSGARVNTKHPQQGNYPTGSEVIVTQTTGQNRLTAIIAFWPPWRFTLVKK